MGTILITSKCAHISTISLQRHQAPSVQFPAGPQSPFLSKRANLPAAPRALEIFSLFSRESSLPFHHGSTAMSPRPRCSLSLSLFNARRLEGDAEKWLSRVSRLHVQQAPRATRAAHFFITAALFFFVRYSPARLCKLAHAVLVFVVCAWACV